MRDETGRSTRGRLLALDLGARRVGVAVSDELRLTVRPLPTVRRTSWKNLLRDVSAMCRELDVCGVVVGLPLRLDGSEGDAAREARRAAKNFSRSLALPVYLQDERLTSVEALDVLRASGYDAGEAARRVDGGAAAIILKDFITENSDAAHFANNPERRQEQSGSRADNEE